MIWKIHQDIPIDNIDNFNSKTHSLDDYADFFDCHTENLDSQIGRLDEKTDSLDIHAECHHSQTDSSDSNTDNKKKGVVRWDLEGPISSGYLAHCPHPFSISIPIEFSASYSMITLATKCTLQLLNWTFYYPCLYFVDFFRMWSSMKVFKILKPRSH